MKLRKRSLSQWDQVITSCGPTIPKHKYIFPFLLILLSLISFIALFSLSFLLMTYAH